MDEVRVISDALLEHRWDELFLVCDCGRIPARSHSEHAAEEIVLALRAAGMGVFMFERLGLLEDEIP